MELSLPPHTSGLGGSPLQMFTIRVRSTHELVAVTRLLGLTWHHDSTHFRSSPGSGVEEPGNPGHCQARGRLQRTFSDGYRRAQGLLSFFGVCIAKRPSRKARMAPSQEPRCPTALFWGLSVLGLCACSHSLGSRTEPQCALLPTLPTDPLPFSFLGLPFILFYVFKGVAV